MGPDWDYEMAIYGVSMAPTLEDGDFVCVNVVDPAKVNAISGNGDIIAFNRPEQPLVYPAVVVHRAINKTFRSDLGLYYFQTRGDNNDVPDDWNDKRGENYTWNGMVSQKLLIGKVVGVRKTYALEQPAIVMVAVLASIIAIDFLGLKRLHASASSWKFLLFSVTVGALASLITGLIENPPIIGVQDSIYYGYPFVWRIATLPSLTDIRFSLLVVDLIFWSSVAFLIMYIIKWYHAKEYS